MLVKARACGISTEEVPDTPLADIIIGYEAKKLEWYHLSLPMIDYQLSKLSPVSLGRAKREEKEKPENETKEQRERRKQEEDDRELGEPILERIRRQTHLRHMPEIWQAADVRKHGWPKPDTEEDKSKSIEGLDPKLAREIVLFAQSGEIKDNNAPIWKLTKRLRATVGTK